MDFCKILKPFGFLTENDKIKGIFISHNSEKNIMTIIHHDSVAMKEDIDDYDLFLIVDTNPLLYNEQNIARIEFTDAQHEQILTFLEAQ
jgi:hypothetical protein